MPRRSLDAARGTNVPDWIPVAGVVLGALTLVFLMALTIMAAFRQEVPDNSRFLVVAVLALGTALSSSFLGGTAAAKGKLPIPFATSNPLEFSVAGGIGVLVIVMVVGYYLYISPSKHDSDIPTGQAIVFDGFANYDRSGFNFSSQNIVAWGSGRADILVSNTQPPGPAAKFFTQYEVPPYTGANQDKGARAGLIQMPQSRLKDVFECPAEGYEGHWLDTSVGTVYCVRTRDGAHYAIIKVTGLYKDRIAFEWAYQPDGSRKFK